MEGSPDGDLEIMLTIMFFGMLGGMVGLTAYELIHEAYGGKRRLHDRYHE
jgi:hypothetical protein